MSLTARPQVYRMYYIYNKNILVCVIPSITIAGLFGEFTLPSCVPRCYSITVFLVVGCGLTNQLRDLTTPSGLEARGRWTAACFCLTLL